MLAVTTWILAAGALARAQTVPTAYSYSYTTEAPSMTPTASLAPTRTETYAPSRMTEAPSYAPTTDTYEEFKGALSIGAAAVTITTVTVTATATTTSPSSPHFPPPPGGHRPGAPLPQSPTHSADAPISMTD